MSQLKSVLRNDLDHENAQEPNHKLNHHLKYTRVANSAKIVNQPSIQWINVDEEK